MAKLLVAEDEPVLRMLILDTLEDEGHDIDVAHDGQEALDKLLASAYDLVILDNMMPIMTGMEVIEHLRAQPAGSSTRVLMLSAKNQVSDRERVLSAGADGFMPKPFSPMDLISKVEELLDG
ncbi:response regulator transcription factor [Cohnella candidum]|uniref:Response regulator n=1 Tax=Cohnella candidum TaxID=2674991 RepID=A0A3G3JWT9_9BACL|nr:response regulator [Cohnella candidum]AYQ72664.1 response regulator [Cohnella candidum]